jgi:cytohesin
MLNLCLIIFILTSFIGCGFFSGDKPIHKAAEKGDLEKVKKIIKEDPNQVNIQNMLRPLEKAAKFRHYDTVKALLVHGANVNCKNIFGQTPSHWAALWSNKEMIDLLLSYGADISVRDENNEIPLHWAAKGDNKEVVDSLLSHGADVFAKNNDNQTPREVALEYGRNKLAQYLKTKEERKEEENKS